jgi:N-acetylmuramoyl-L-alanine amidase
VAEQENKADSAAGVEAREDASDVTDILFDLTRRETRAFSHVFAHSLSEYWKVAARLNKNPRRSAGFVVLKAPDVPSVLLELGYLSNDTDAADLGSPAWREKSAAQVAQAVDAFFAARQPEKSATPAPERESKGGALKATQSDGN